MYSITVGARVNRLLRRAAALAATGIACTAMVAAVPAHAQPVGGTGATRGCPVEDEHGNVTYVSVGTQIGLFHCGSDGEWHFGWATTDRLSPPAGSTSPVAGATQSASVMR